jgi:FtsP/CotA-like multicopper oxidase with cupredoxin domain
VTQRHGTAKPSRLFAPRARVSFFPVMLGGDQTTEIDFADQRGLTLFHCHQQIHMDFGFMGLYETT